MIKDFARQQLDLNNPNEYIYKLRVMQNELDDLMREFNKKYTYCCGCQGYVKVADSKENVENGRIVVRCGKCNSIWMFKS